MMKKKHAAFAFQEIAVLINWNDCTTLKLMAKTNVS